MRLVLHIVAKDLRRMAVPIGLWLGLIVAGAIGFQSIPITVEGHAGSEIDTWLTTTRIWTVLLLVVQLLMGYLLTGTLGIEDPLVGSGEFWMTRPIGRVRLFAAKLVGTVLFFVVAPVLVLLPIWIANGFALLELWHAMGEVALRHGLLAFLALTLSSLIRSLAHFLLSTVVVVMVYVLAASLLARAAVFGWPYVVASAATATVFALVSQFLTGGVARSRWMVAMTLMACGLTTTGWPWVVRGAWSAARIPTPQKTALAQRGGETDAAEIEVDSLFSKYRDTRER